MRKLSLLWILLAALLIGCTSHPKITVEDIENDIRGRNTGEGLMSWRFESNEPRTITIINSKYEGDKATLIVNIDTKSAPGSFIRRTASGRLRLHYEWISDDWALTKVENIGFTYR
jgi:hypothetical protein